MQQQLHGPGEARSGPRTCGSRCARVGRATSSRVLVSGGQACSEALVGANLESAGVRAGRPEDRHGDWSGQSSWSPATPRCGAAPWPRAGQWGRLPRAMLTACNPLPTPLKGATHRVVRKYQAPGPGPRHSMRASSGRRRQGRAVGLRPRAADIRAPSALFPEPGRPHADATPSPPNCTGCTATFEDGEWLGLASRAKEVDEGARDLASGSPL